MIKFKKEKEKRKNSWVLPGRKIFRKLLNA
jgi:hypothetical protein